MQRCVHHRYRIQDKERLAQVVCSELTLSMVYGPYLHYHIYVYVAVYVVSGEKGEGEEKEREKASLWWWPGKIRVFLGSCKKTTSIRGIVDIARCTICLFA